jgi:hypothetical protein
MRSIIGVSSLFLPCLKLHLHIYLSLSYYERVTWFIMMGQCIDWRNDTQKKGLAYAKSYDSCIVGTNSPLITRRIWCSNLLIPELRLSSTYYVRVLVTCPFALDVLNE